MTTIPGLAVFCLTGRLPARFIVGIFLGVLGGLLALRYEFIGMYLLTVATTGLAALYLTVKVLMLPGVVVVWMFSGRLRRILGLPPETTGAIVPYGWWVCWALVVLPWFLYRAKRQSGWLVVAIVLAVLYTIAGIGLALLFSRGFLD